ncbi:hypothetical protein D3C83_220020 [compost metagenome]
MAKEDAFGIEFFDFFNINGADANLCDRAEFASPCHHACMVALGAVVGLACIAMSINLQN